MKCSNCGNEIMNGDKFCQKCGLPVKTTTSQQVQQPNSNQQPLQPQKPQKAWYKKWWIWFLMGLGTIVLLFNMTCTCAMCIPTSKPTNTSATQAQTEKATEFQTEKPTEIETEKPTEKATEAPTEKPTEALKKQDNVIYDNNGIKITCLGTEEDIFGTNVKLHIENNSGKDYTFHVKDVSVNGYMVDPLFSCDVNDGKKANDELSFLQTSLKKTI